MKTISGEAQIEREIERKTARRRDRQREGETGQRDKRRDRQGEGETDRESRAGRGWVWFLDVYVTLKRAVDTRLSAEQDPHVSVSSWPPPHE